MLARRRRFDHIQCFPASPNHHARLSRLMSRRISNSAERAVSIQLVTHANGTALHGGSLCLETLDHVFDQEECDV
jgi:hypothetical protein